MANQDCGFRWTAVAVLALAVAACSHGGSHDPSSSLPSSLTFIQSPIPTVSITTITPIGNLNPPGHTLPTNHSYFYHPSAANAEVTAPAGGTIFDARPDPSGNGAIYVQAATGIVYYLAHVRLDSGLVTGGHVSAGQRLGVTESASAALDLGVSNDGVTLFFVRPERYIPFTIHADSALKYFQEPVRSELYAKVQRIGSDKDGKINFDQAGRLVGNWFLDGTPVATSENTENWPKHLAFARDVIDPSIVRISIGGSLSIAGGFFVSSSAVDPADVTPATGKVAYRLYSNALRTGTGTPLLIAQMLADDRVQVETSPADTPESATFTSAALIYVR